MTYNHLLVSQKGGILTIALNREEKLNALNQAVLSELHTVLSEASSTVSVRGIILTGAGQRAFAAGADISELQNLTAEEAERMASKAQESVFNLIESFSKPVIAAINGYALGGGLELALACHIRLASENAVMGLPELRLGIIPGFGGTQRLTHIVGRGPALELILSSKQISAFEAMRIGLVNHIVRPEKLLQLAQELMLGILKNPPNAIAAAIKAVNAAVTSDGFQQEINAFGSCFENSESREGINAFLEKRKPSFF